MLKTSIAETSSRFLALSCVFLVGLGAVFSILMVWMFTPYTAKIPPGLNVAAYLTLLAGQKLNKNNPARRALARKYSFLICLAAWLATTFLHGASFTGAGIEKLWVIVLFYLPGVPVCLYALKDEDFFAQHLVKDPPP